MDVLRGGVQGLKRTRNPLKLPSNTLRGLNAGLTRGVKRKAEDVIKKEITKQAKKALSNKNVKKAVLVASALFPKQVKRARDIFGVQTWIPCLRALDGFVVIVAYLNVEDCFLFGNSCDDNGEDG